MKLIRVVLLLVHIAVLFLLFCTLLNAYVPPKIFPYLNVLSLIFPILLMVHLILCLCWIIWWKKRAFVFILLSVFLFNPTRRWVNYNPVSKKTPSLKVMTYNIKGSNEGVKKISDLIEKEKPDIAIIQEAGYVQSDLPYNEQIKEFPLIYLGTNYKVIEKKAVDNSGTNGNCFYADLEIHGKRIRVVNIYLNPFSFEREKVKPEDNLEENKAKLGYVIRKLLPTFRMHQDEVTWIKEFIEQSPYPVIVAGDFNSVPNSFEYYHLVKGLQDAFVEVGCGSATSFHDYKYPIRIDYIFNSKSIEPVSYRVDRSVKLSDHFPVFAEFKID